MTIDVQHKKLFENSFYQTIKLKIITDGGESEYTSYISQIRGNITHKHCKHLARKFYHYSFLDAAINNHLQFGK